MDGQRTLCSARLAMVLVLFSLPAFSGCAGFLGNLGYWSGASQVPAEYAGLEQHRVAVICISDSSSYGAGTEDRILAGMVSKLLQENVPEIEIVPASEVADWIDKNDWDSLDYREVGRGVKADRVVAIDLAGFSLHEDQVLYKARADITVTVFDMTDGGKEVFRRHVPEITYPSTGYYQTSDTSEAMFRQVFLRKLSQRAARYFYTYDSLNESKLDPAVAGRRTGSED